MAASCYLVGKDFEEFGVPLTTPGMVVRASLLVDHYLRRPEGCIYGLDANLQPAFMVAQPPSMTYTFAGTIIPGTNVPIPLPGYSGDSDSLIGETVVLDRLIPAICEVCVVQGEQSGQLTLTNVQFLHTGVSTPVTIEVGMSISEELSMPNQRSVARLAEWPVSRVLSGIGRYGYGRRTDQDLGYFYDMNLLSTLSAFGGPPSWTPFTIAASSLNPLSGNIWVPAGALLSYYTDIKVRYIGGWLASALPPPIKSATAMIVDALTASPMGAQIRRFNVGKTQIERFADSVMGPDIKGVLRPFMANWMV